MNSFRSLAFSNTPSSEEDRGAVWSFLVLHRVGATSPAAIPHRALAQQSLPSAETESHRNPNSTSDRAAILPPGFRMSKEPAAAKMRSPPAQVAMRDEAC